MRIFVLTLLAYLAWGASCAKQPPLQDDEIDRGVNTDWFELNPARISDKFEPPTGYGYQPGGRREQERQFLMELEAHRHEGRNTEWIRRSQRLDDPCPRACNVDYRPVCGSDGKTYPSRCEMAATACLEKRRISVHWEGRCDTDHRND